MSSSKRFKKLVFFFTLNDNKKFIRYFSSKFISFKKKKDIKGNIIINSKRSYKNAYMLNSFNSLSYKYSVIVDFKINPNGIFLSLLKNSLGFFFLLSSANGVFLGDFIKVSYYPIKFFKKFILGSKNCVRNLLENFFFFSVLFKSSYKISLAKSSGVYCQVLTFFRDLNLVLILLPSKKKVYINDLSLCLIGRSSNFLKKYSFFTTHSLSYHLGKKSLVRGVAKNPVDHPHGGRTKTVKPEVSPWGWVTKFSH